MNPAFLCDVLSGARSAWPLGALVLALVVAGCAGSADAPEPAPGPAPAPAPAPNPAPRPGPSAEPGVPFALAYGSTATVDGVTVTFAEVTEDSRCPEDVDCVWAGRATIRLALRNGSETGEALPSIGGMGAEGGSSEALGYRFTLQALTPYPNTTRSADDRTPLAATLVVVPVAP